MLENGVEEIGMSIETVKNWPVTAVCLPKGNVPQVESVSHLSVSDRRDSDVLGNSKDPRPDTMWEKGTFIDLYT
jgi:hypothetical protein